MKKFLIKIVSVLLLSAFFTDTCCYGLATLPASQNPIAKREILAALQRTQIRYAESEDTIKLLETNNAQCLLLSSGKYLVTKEVAENDISLLRAIIHEDTEAMMQILAEESRRNKNAKYQAIKELIITYFPPVKANLIKYYPRNDYDEFSTELYVNHLVAKAFEWLALIRDGVILRSDIPYTEKEYIETIEPIIDSKKYNYFTAEFWDSNVRGETIRAALNGGARFYLVGNSNNDTKMAGNHQVPQDYRHVEELIDDVLRVLSDEQKNGLLAEKISDIDSNRYFVEGRIAYIPDKEGRLIVIGDTHGDSISTKQILEQEHFVERVNAGEKLHVVFLGDYIGEGKNSIENLKTILELKKAYPHHVTLLVGNHEYIDENREKTEVYKIAHPDFEREHWLIDNAPKDFLESFRRFVDNLPVMAVTSNGIVLAHSGAPSLQSEKNKARCAAGLLSIRDDPALQGEIFTVLVNSKKVEFDDREVSQNVTGRNFVKYWTGQASFERFMDSIGGRIMVRGHDSRADKNLTLFDGRFITIISTGGTNAESGKDYAVISPRYAVFEFSENYEKIDANKCVFDVTSHIYAVNLSASPNPKVAFFDLDGTLLDSMPYAEIAFGKIYHWIMDATADDPPQESITGCKEYLSSVGWKTLSDHVATMISMSRHSAGELQTVINSLSQRLKIKDIEGLTGDLVAEFSLIYEAVLMREFEARPPELFRGVRQFLEQLQQAGIKMYVGTGSPQKIAEYLVEKLKIKKYFVAVYGDTTSTSSSPRGKAEMLKSIKSDNGIEENNQIIIFGDSDGDMSVSDIDNNGNKCIAVGISHGNKRSMKKLIKAGAAFIIQDFGNWESYWGKLGLRKYADDQSTRYEELACPITPDSFNVNNVKYIARFLQYLNPGHPLVSDPKNHDAVIEDRKLGERFSVVHFIPQDVINGSDEYKKLIAAIKGSLAYRNNKLFITPQENLHFTIPTEFDKQPAYGDELLEFVRTKIEHSGEIAVKVSGLLASERAGNGRIYLKFYPEIDISGVKNKVSALIEKLQGQDRDFKAYGAGLIHLRDNLTEEEAAGLRDIFDMFENRTIFEYHIREVQVLSITNSSLRDKRIVGMVSLVTPGPESRGRALPIPVIGGPSYDPESTTVLLTDLLYAQLHEGRFYEIKYDASRLTASQIGIIEEYVRLLQLRSSNPDSIRLRPFSSVRGSKESLIAVYCTGSNFKGEGHVDIALPDGELKDYLLRITGMVNIALASSNIPDDLSKEDVDKYRSIMSYIRNQYKAIVGEELAIPDDPKEILKVIRRIALGLPVSMRMNAGRIEEYDRLAKQALTAA